MILKFQDHKDQWSWIAQVDELQQLGKDPVDSHEYGIGETEYLGESDGSLPIFMLARVDGVDRLLAIHCTQAYLCHDETGSTIDVVYQKA